MFVKTSTEFKNKLVCIRPARMRVQRTQIKTNSNDIVMIIIIIIISSSSSSSNNVIVISIIIMFIITLKSTYEYFLLLVRI